MVTRAAFLRGASASLAGLVAVPVAHALPAPVPVGDDEGFLQFAVLAERATVAYYRRAAGGAAHLDALRDAAHRKAGHAQRLVAALGADAPPASAFSLVLPERAFRTRAGTLALGIRLESLLVGVLLSGVAAAGDVGTRLLLGRLLAADAQQLAVLHRLAGRPVAAGLPAPVGLSVAGAQLDALLRASGYPTA